MTAAVAEVSTSPAPAPQAGNTENTSSDNVAPTEDHFLHREWEVWYDKPIQAAPNTTWKENLKSVGVFNTVQSFWRIFNNIKPPSQLTIGSKHRL